MSDNSTKKVFKILIMGISGDYAKRKILPSIGQFANDYGDQINLQIIGYSRSKVELSEIQQILKTTTEKQISIELQTGQYTDVSFFSDQLESLEANEKLLCYLALPPSVYLGFLNNICYVTKKDFTILIEKPFGQNLAESELLLQSVMKCHLYHNVFFVDHYLFKSASRIHLESIFNRFELNFRDLESVQIRALETLGVEGRIGYYDQTGATKDMFPHLYSLLLHVLTQLGLKNSIASWSIENHETEQYPGYLADLGITDSKTETYFKTSALAYFPDKVLPVSFESGKQQLQKITDIKMDFGEHQVELNFAPENCLKVFKKDELLQTIPVLDIALGDHERMFRDILEGNYDFFVKADKIVEYWQLIEKIDKKA
jgi:glucose-6-phosphate 1-dehydrogenase